MELVAKHNDEVQIRARRIIADWRAATQMSVLLRGISAGRERV
jgi:hypothetical protein